MTLLSYALFGLTQHTFDPSHTFTTSPFLRPTILASVRAIAAIYVFSTIIVGYSWQASNLSALHLHDFNIPSYLIITNWKAIGRSFSYFTYLSFWSQGFYFLVSAVHTFAEGRRGTSWLHDRFARPLQLAHSLWYTSVICLPWLVSIVFWGTMYSGPWPGQRYTQWLNISVHGLNSAFALMEIVLGNSTVPPVTHVGVLLLLNSLYLGLAYLTKWMQGWYVYEWLNPAHGSASIVLHVLGYAGGTVAIFAVVSLLIRLRIFAVKKWLAKWESNRKEAAGGFNLVCESHK